MPYILPENVSYKNNLLFKKKERNVCFYLLCMGEFLHVCMSTMFLPGTQSPRNSEEVVRTSGTGLTGSCESP